MRTRLGTTDSTEQPGRSTSQNRPFVVAMVSADSAVGLIDSKPGFLRPQGPKSRCLAATNSLSVSAPDR